MTPDQLAKSGSEHAHQVALMQQCAIQMQRYPQLNMLFAVPNGGDRNPRVGAQMKAEGVKAGVPDLMLAVPSCGHAGLFIEMKKPANFTVADTQYEWRARLLKQHYAHAFCAGWEVAWRLIECYLDGKYKQDYSTGEVFTKWQQIGHTYL